MATRKKSDIYLAGGAILLAGASVLSWLTKWPPEVWGPHPAQLTLSVVPTEVQEGSGVPVVASGNYTMNGQPSAGSIHMRVRHPSGLYENLPSKMGPSFAEAIPTSGKQVGEYVVEAADNPSFV